MTVPNYLSKAVIRILKTGSQEHGDLESKNANQWVWLDT